MDGGMREKQDGIARWLLEHHGEAKIKVLSEIERHRTYEDENGVGQSYVLPEGSFVASLRGWYGDGKEYGNIVEGTVLTGEVAVDTLGLLVENLTLSEERVMGMETKE